MESWKNICPVKKISSCISTFLARTWNTQDYLSHICPAQKTSAPSVQVKNTGFFWFQPVLSQFGQQVL